MAKSFFEKLTGSSSDEEAYDYGEPIAKDAEGDSELANYNDNDEAYLDSGETDTEKHDKEEPDDVMEEVHAELASASTKTQSQTKTKSVQQNTKRQAEHATDIMEESEGQLAIDVYETSDEIVIKSTIAGVKPEDVDVSITNDTVTIRGTRKKDEQVSNQHYFYQECYWGIFSRSVILPVEIDSEKAKATFKNGILAIHLPKLEKASKKKINIVSS